MRERERSICLLLQGHQYFTRISPRITDTQQREENNCDHFKENGFPLSSPHFIHTIEVRFQKRKRSPRFCNRGIDELEKKITNLSYTVDKF
jgi:hypothetical protein